MFQQEIRAMVYIKEIFPSSTRIIFFTGLAKYSCFQLMTWIKIQEQHGRRREQKTKYCSMISIYSLYTQVDKHAE